MSARTKAREMALQILYKVDIAEGTIEEAFTNGMAKAMEDAAFAYCGTLTRGVIEKRAEIDSAIGAFSENWTVDRMAVVDRNVLRIAVYELLYCPDVPYKVVIDEAIELAKRFGAEQSGAFINGILDRVYKNTLRKGVSSAC